MKPWLFMDIDGSLVPEDFAPRQEGADRPKPPASEIRWSDIEHGRIVAFLPSQMHQYLQALISCFDLVWVSSWNGRAQLVEQAAQIVSCQQLSLHRRYEGPCEKGGALAHFLDDDANTRPFAWVDDEMDQHYASLTIQDTELPEHILIAPDSTLGITSAHVAALIAFAKAAGNA